MFNKYKYKPCQCYCHVKYGTNVIYWECKCDCASIDMTAQTFNARDNLVEKNYQLENEIRDLQLKYQGWDSMLNRVKELVAENEKLKAENEQLNKYAKILNENKDSLLNSLRLSQEYAKKVERMLFHSYEKYEELKAQLQSKFDTGIDFAECDKSHTSKDVINCFACLPRWYLTSEKRNEELLKRLHELQNRDNNSQVERKPHVCPVCQGKGIHERTAHELSQIHHYNVSKYYGCTACNCKGIVWEPKQ
jgi:hypothetical protein